MSADITLHYNDIIALLLEGNNSNHNSHNDNSNHVNVNDNPTPPLLTFIIASLASQSSLAPPLLLTFTIPSITSTITTPTA